MSEKYFRIPYIGVSDVGSRENIVHLAGRFVALSQYGQLSLKAGITMTRKVLWGIPSKWKPACPPKRHLKQIFAEKIDMVMNVVHYADYDGVDLAPSIERIIGLSGPNLHGIQLDMVWPDPSILEMFRKSHSGLEFILQVGDKALAEVDENPFKMWQAVKNYDGLISRILLDRSGGKGKALNARSLIRFVDILYDRMNEPSVVVAGGLGPKTLQLVEPLFALYPQLSIDAQGQLRDSGRTLDGPISMLRTLEYVSLAATMHRKYNLMV